MVKKRKERDVKTEEKQIVKESARNIMDENWANAPFPIVGIGASAGGLAAFEAFFSGLPDDTNPGMAFVLVQHLAPDHTSILTDLIRRYTRMQVFEVEDGMVEAVSKLRSSKQTKRPVGKTGLFQFLYLTYFSKLILQGQTSSIFDKVC
jgi:chemotaxis response regulator CheB